MNKVFPTIIIALMLASGIVYLYNKDYRKAIYWIAAACLNASVVW